MVGMGGLRIGPLPCRSEAKVGSWRAWQHTTPRLVSADADISLAAVSLLIRVGRQHEPVACVGIDTPAINLRVAC